MLEYYVNVNQINAVCCNTRASNTGQFDGAIALLTYILNIPHLWLQKSTNNDLAAFKSAFHIRDQFPKLGQALLLSMQQHYWYLTWQLALLTIADDDVGG